MVPEFLENDRLRRFESELGKSLADGHIDYSKVFEEVVEKIKKTDLEGPLGVLKKDEIASLSFMERVEDGIARRICEHLEYDLPIDECIHDDRKVPQRYWGYLERKLSEKIKTVSPVSVEEQILKTDEILDQGKFEAIEKGLFDRICDYENTHMPATPRHLPWTVFSFPTVWPVAASFFICVSAIVGYVAYKNSVKPIPTVLYQAQGSNLEILKTPLSAEGVVQSEKGGSLTIVNKKGYVELRNGSKLEIVKASDKEMRYTARFADVDKQLVGQGSATFFVNRQKKNEKYIVSTLDYRIEVTGTYFRLQPDIDGHVSVAVREGEVNIVFNNGDVRQLKAGQNLAFDLNRNTFTTNSDGITVPRQEIEQMPDIRDLADYTQLSIGSSPSAAILIDDHYIGTSPLMIMQTQGTHTVRVEKTGYRTIDTTLFLQPAKPGVFKFTLKESSSEEQLSELDNRLKGKQKRPLERDGNLASVKEPLNLKYNENDFRTAERFEFKNWQKAFAIYRAIFANSQAPRLRKEAALFSMAKLYAEHGPDKHRAREGFLNYLALYPTGNFVGESWLRLAELEFEHDQNKSIEYYERYFEKYPRHSRISELQYRVGLIFLQKKRYDEAISMLKRSLANYQNGDAIDTEKIKTALYKAFKEQNESLADYPPSANSNVR
jgi:TolA-binding protein